MLQKTRYAAGLANRTRPLADAASHGIGAQRTIHNNAITGFIGQKLYAKVRLKWLFLREWSDTGFLASRWYSNAGANSSVKCSRRSFQTVVNLAGQGTSAAASGRIFWTEDAPQKKWLLYVRNLPPVPQDKVYELRFVPKSGNPVGVARFNTEGDGYYEVEIDLPAGLSGLKAAAVTTGTFPGADQPTGSFALLGASE